MNDHPTERTLQRLADGDLTGPDRWDVENHVSACAECERRYEAHRMLIAEIGALPASIEPPFDLWPEIAERIDSSPRVRSIASRSAQHRGARYGLNAQWLGWSVGLAAALTIGIALGRQLPTPEFPVTADAAAAGDPVALLASYEEPSYETAIVELETILVAMRNELRPETVAVVEENLAIIDQAIADARDALRADPANEYLHRHLSATMQTKLGLLRMVTGAVES